MCLDYFNLLPYPPTMFNLTVRTANYFSEEVGAEDVWNLSSALFQRAVSFGFLPSEL